MKVSNEKEPSKTDDGVSRSELNEWQRKDAKGRTDKVENSGADPKGVGKQAEG
jgi:hypothetical protein